MRTSKRFFVLFFLALLSSLPALSNTCDIFAKYSCSTKPHWDDVSRLGGGVASGLQVGILLDSNTFDVGLTHKVKTGLTGLDVVIAAVFPKGLGGKLTASDGVTSGFTKLKDFPEDGALGAVTQSWSKLGISSKNPVFGYANLGISKTATLSITASGVPKDAVLYAIVINPANNKVIYITPNSEAGIFNGKGVPAPEPSALNLLAAGLVGLVGFASRKIGRG